LRLRRFRPGIPQEIALATKSQKTKVGVFMLLCGLLMGGSLYLISGFYQDQGVRYWLEFEDSILGLYEGAMVEYLGVPVGKVHAIRVRPDSNKPQIDISIDSTKVLLHKGVQAKLVMHSIAAGTMAISLTGGDVAQGRLPENSQIPTVPSAITAIAGQLQDVMKRVEGIMGQVETGLEGMESGELTAVIDKVSGLLDDGKVFLADTKELVNSATETVDGVRGDLDQVVDSALEVIEELKPTIKNVNDLVVTSKEKVAELDVDAAQEQLTKVLENVAQLTEKLNVTMGEVDNLTANALHEADNVETSLRKALGDMSEALYVMRVFVEQLNANPSALIRGKETPKE
jgi:ABC-type transporter Mla subunit MlaD